MRCNGYDFENTFEYWIGMFFPVNTNVPEGNGDMKGPVWWTDKDKMYSDDVRPSDDELYNMKKVLLLELEKLKN